MRTLFSHHDMMGVDFISSISHCSLCGVVRNMMMNEFRFLIGGVNDCLICLVRFNFTLTIELKSLVLISQFNGR